MTKPPVPLTALSEDQRAQAHSRFPIIRAALEDGVTQAKGQHVPALSLPAPSGLWVKRSREMGLAGRGRGPGAF